MLLLTLLFYTVWYWNGLKGGKSSLGKCFKLFFQQNIYIYFIYMYMYTCCSIELEHRCSVDIHKERESVVRKTAA